MKIVEKNMIFDVTYNYLINMENSKVIAAER